MSAATNIELMSTRTGDLIGTSTSFPGLVALLNAKFASVRWGFRTASGPLVSREKEGAEP
jgi:hypothetical protein